MQFPLLILLSLGHLVTDLSGGVLPMLLPVLKEEFHLSYVALSLIILVANLSSSVLQPFFGVWSDRVPSRWLMPLGCFLSALGICLAGLATGYTLILAGVFLSGVGTAAYHPEGSKQTFLISGEQKGVAMSVYSVGGNIGFGLGPLVGTLLLAWGGHRGMLGLLVPAAVTAILINAFLPAIARRGKVLQASRHRELDCPDGAGRRVWGAVFLLVLIVTLRSWVHIGVTTFVPLYYVDYLKGSYHYASFLLTLFLMAGAVGTIAGGPLADRWGRRQIMLLSFLLAIPPVWLLPYSHGAWSAVLMVWSGFALISTFAITVVYAQELIPNNVGLASGLMLGFSVGMGALFVLPLGAVADAWGVPAVLKLLAVLPVAAVLLTLLLPGRQAAGRTAFLSGTERPY